MNNQIRTALPAFALAAALDSALAMAAAPVHAQDKAAKEKCFGSAAAGKNDCWSTHDGAFLNDLLPLVYDQLTLDRVCAHIEQVQSHLRTRQVKPR